MREVLDLTEPEKIALGLGMLIGVISWVPRIRLFTRDSSDPALTELLDDTFPTTFQDLLAFHLAFRWRRLDRASKHVSAPFLFTYFLASALLLYGLVPAIFRRFF